MSIHFKPASFQFSPKLPTPNGSNAGKVLTSQPKTKDISTRSVSASSTSPTSGKTVLASGKDNESSTNSSSPNKKLDFNESKGTNRIITSTSSTAKGGGIMSALLDVDINTPDKDLKTLHGIGGLKSQSASTTLMELKRLEKLKEEELAYYLNNPSLIENRNSTQQALYINQKYEHLIPKGVLSDKKNNGLSSSSQMNQSKSRSIAAQEALLSRHQNDMERNHKDALRSLALQKKMGKNVKRSKSQQKLKQKAKGSSYNDKLEQKRQNSRGAKRKK